MWHRDVDMVVVAGGRVGPYLLAVLPEPSPRAGVDQLQAGGTQRLQGPVDVSKGQRIPPWCLPSEVHREALRMETSGVRAEGGCDPVWNSAVLHVPNQAIYYRKGHDYLLGVPKVI